MVSISSIETTVIRTGSIVFHTDGSKLNDEVVAGVTGPGVSKSNPMGKWPTVFQVIFYAKTNDIQIYDSQAAFKSSIYTSKHVLECIQSLLKLSR